MHSDNREDLLARVASLYYEYDYSQQQIGEMLTISRSNISRMLKEAKQKGLVEIRIHKRIPTVPQIERELRERFGLHQAMVVDQRDADYETHLASAGQLAAWYLEELLRPNAVLAIAWGTGVAAAVNAFSIHPVMHTEVVQMLGSVGSSVSEIDGPDLARRLATKLGGQYYYLHAPLIVDSRATRDTFLEQSMIQRTLAQARRAQIAIVGVGTVDPESSSFLRAGHMTKEQLTELRKQGIVGETGGQYFDINGASNFDINQRVIALGLDDIKHIPYVTAVACGLPKTRSILGALRSGNIKALATDSITAEAILKEDSQH
jgi:DNA-binding transcriptional regulator LsrR (DeoR family)